MPRVVCAENIDELVRPALQLVEVVGEVYGEIGDFACRGLQNAVFAVAETSGFHDQVSLGKVAFGGARGFRGGQGIVFGESLLLQALQQSFDRAFGDELAFGDEAVEAHA